MMQTQSAPILPWTQLEWIEQAHGWITAELCHLGIRLTGSIAQSHMRPWSTVMHVPTDSGLLYFKATMPALAHEPRLTQALAQWHPDCIPNVIAINAERGWMLMRDSGVSMRSLLRADHDVGHWLRALSLYAELQIALAPRANALSSLGALDRRLATLPAQFDDVLGDTAMLRIGLPDGLAVEEYQRLQQLRPRVAALCERLAGYRIPETLHHDDFHDGNIFIQDGRIVFTDWAESCVAHPFFSLVIAQRSAAYTLNLVEGSPELMQLREAYLASWAQFDSPDRLMQAFSLAQQLGTLCRALTWHKVLTNLPKAAREDDRDAVPGWLQEFLKALSTDR